MTTPKTRVEPVHAQVRAEILNGSLTPGSKIPLMKTARRLDASVGVLREALIRLGSEGLVLAEPQLGFRVASVSRDDLDELIEARIVVECETFRSALGRGSHNWEADVLGAYHRMRRVEDEHDGGRNEGAWVAAHRDFHEALLSGCTNRRLLAAAMALRDAAELYRSASVMTMTPKDAAQRDAEHAALRDSVLDRDTDVGVALLADHIRMTARYFDLSAPEDQKEPPVSAVTPN